MSLKIQAPPADVARGLDRSHDLSAAKTGGTAPSEKAAADAAKVGRDFEAILVRQMLSQVKVAGKGGYADMAVESLAASVTAAGGLGLGRTIEQALTRVTHGDGPATPAAPAKK